MPRIPAHPLNHEGTSETIFETIKRAKETGSWVPPKPGLVTMDPKLEKPSRSQFEISAKQLDNEPTR